MARTGARDTAPEMALRRELHRRGLRFRVDRPVLADRRRRVDIVFGPAKVAVFVDGCFWHGCPVHATQPRANSRYWREKIATNQRRDRDTDRQLAASGWTVIRIWEHENPVNAASRVEETVRRRREQRQEPGRRRL
jgi:DNA mismatch endonuclease (patch repair protein)